MSEPRYEYRAVQINEVDEIEDRTGPGPFFFTYKTLEGARSRRDQIADIPGALVREVQRREIGPWETVEDAPKVPIPKLGATPHEHQAFLKAQFLRKVPE